MRCSVADVAAVLNQRSLFAHHQPRDSPHQADHAKRTERVVPAVIDDDPVQRRHRKDHAERRTLRENGGGQRALLVGKPFVERMRRHRERRPLAGAEDDAADQKRGETDRAHHRKLRHRPDHRHRQQHPAGVDAIDDEADDDGRDRKQEEERRTEQAELLRRELQFVHDRRAGEADHDLVGKVHQHEQEEEKCDLPGARRRFLGVACAVMAAFPVQLSFRLCKISRSGWYKAVPGQGNRGFCGGARTATAGWCRKTAPQPDHGRAISRLKP